MDAIVHLDASTLRVTTHNQYVSATLLTPSSVQSSPFTQFDEWFVSASASGVKEPEAMSLSTCTPAGIPSSRIVLLKQVDARGFVFFTNYTSRKSRELAQNPHAALAFYWKEVSRQIRVVGRVEKVSKQESDAYFKSRPIGSRVGAWASQQSSIVGEDELAERVEEIKTRFGVTDEMAEANIPLPEFWGGWRIIPDEVEFWAGRPSRLHDRVRYLRVEGSSDGAPEWKIERLSP
ncbi:pyridoxamine 5'-phosphate oxidase [Ramaria rubella]|nr:pyridoxamine 5'-phosphate oxidase [Ramaria rubella]